MRKNALITVLVGAVIRVKCQLPTADPQEKKTRVPWTGLDSITALTQS